MENKDEKNQKGNNQNEKYQIIDYYQKIIERADKEIGHVHSVYKWLAWILGIIIAVGVGIGTYITWNTFSDMRRDLREETNAITSRFEKEVDLVGRQVRSRIEEEFDKENIHKLVQETTKKRIDEVADQLISKNINDKVMPLITTLVKQIEDANNRLTVMEDRYKTAVELAENNLNKQETIIEYLKTVSAAQNDDRKAYEKLEAWSKDKSFLLSSQASIATLKIRSMHDNPLYTERNITWKAGIDPSKLTLSDLKKYYEVLQDFDSYKKTAMITYIWKREDIPTRNKMEFLIDVIKNDENLAAVEYAGRYFSQGAGFEKDPLAVNDFVNWWNKNKDQIK